MAVLGASVRYINDRRYLRGRVVLRGERGEVMGEGGWLSRREGVEGKGWQGGGGAANKLLPDQAGIFKSFLQSRIWTLPP